MTFRLTCLVFVPILVICFTAQSQEAPGFRAQANLVLVPVQVRSHGQHVSGLKPEIFTLLQDGKPQRIAFVEEVRTSTQRLRPMPVGPREFTNQLLGTPELRVTRSLRLIG